MASTCSSIELPAPPEEVWEVVTDMSRLDEWLTVHDEFPDGTPRNIRNGTQFCTKVSAAGASFEIEWTATELDPPRQMIWEAEGPGGSTARTVFELSPTDDGGTRFSYTSDIQLPGGPLGAVAVKVVEGQTETESERSLERLRALFGT